MLINDYTMKTIKYSLFVLLATLLYSCSNEMLFDTDMTDTSTTTRAVTSDSIYYFGSSDATMVDDFVFHPKDDPKPLSRTLCSYVEFNGVKILLQPEIVSKPSWVSYIICFQYYDIYVLSVIAEDNTSSERSGNIVLKQPGSNKTLSIGITQYGINNHIRIQVNKTYHNHYEFIATTDYPVKADIWAKIPVVVYNDGSELTEQIIIDIAKGERTGSSEADWNPSPLVQEHGDIKGYRLYEGRIGGYDDVYTYSFIRYWE